MSTSSDRDSATNHGSRPAVTGEQLGQSVQRVRLPAGEEVRFQTVLAGQFRLAHGIGQQVHNDLGFELGWEGTTGSRH
jgi:hypothetical protein